MKKLGRESIKFLDTRLEGEFKTTTRHLHLAVIALMTFKVVRDIFATQSTIAAEGLVNMSRIPLRFKRGF